MSMRAGVALLAGEIPSLPKNYFRAFLSQDKRGTCKKVESKWDVLALLFHHWDDNSQRTLRKNGDDYVVRITIWAGGIGKRKTLEEHSIPVPDLAHITDLLVNGYVEGPRARGRDYDELRISERGIGALIAYKRTAPVL